MYFEELPQVAQTAIFMEPAKGEEVKLEDLLDKIEANLPAAIKKEEIRRARFDDLWRKESEYPANTIANIAVNLAISNASVEVGSGQPVTDDSRSSAERNL